ncbi:MAG: hypothetical protein R3E18_09280 [Sphingomonadaceae bacterium]|nr:hypothetical protein [Sphingomonadaceae bacterium]
MSDLERQLREDRALRNAARAVVDADVAHLRSVFAPSHLAGMAGDEASDLFDRARDAASSHKGILATLIAAIFIWFARTPILSLLSDGEEDVEDEAGEEPMSDGGVSHE